MSEANIIKTPDYSIFLTMVDGSLVPINENELIGYVCKRLLEQGYVFMREVRSEAKKPYMKLPEVMERTGISRTSIYHRIQSNSFPRPVKLGRSSVWLVEDIDEWFEECKDGQHTHKAGRKRKDK